MNPLARQVGLGLAKYLSRPRPGVQTGIPTDPDKLLACLRPCDVLLVEGSSRVSTAIKYLTQSTWSHAAIFIGATLGGSDAEGNEYLFVEADMVDGICKRPLARYESFHTRICRPRGLAPADRERLITDITRHIGMRYDLKNVFDLARYLLPTPPIPQRWRRRMISFGSGDPTRAICSSLIAGAFQAIGYPVLPTITHVADASRHAAHEIFRARDKSQYVPRDFDVSPYFEIVKPTLAEGFDYRRIEWAGVEGASTRETRDSPLDEIRVG